MNTAKKIEAEQQERLQMESVVTALQAMGSPAARGPPVARGSPAVRGRRSPRKKNNNQII